MWAVVPAKGTYHRLDNVSAYSHHRKLERAFSACAKLLADGKPARVVVWLWSETAPGWELDLGGSMEDVEKGWTVMSDIFGEIWQAIAVRQGTQLEPDDAIDRMEVGNVIRRLEARRADGWKLEDLARAQRLLDGVEVTWRKGHRIFHHQPVPGLSDIERELAETTAET
jgi:hypothetical protein